MMGILRVAKAGWLSGVNNLKVNQWLTFITYQLNAVCRYILWVNRPDIPRLAFTEAETRRLCEEQEKVLIRNGLVCVSSDIHRFVDPLITCHAVPLLHV
jgi:hypothetical protein